MHCTPRRRPSRAHPQTQLASAPRPIHLTRVFRRQPFSSVRFIDKTMDGHENAGTPPNLSSPSPAFGSRSNPRSYVSARGSSYDDPPTGSVRFDASGMPATHARASHPVQDRQRPYLGPGAYRPHARPSDDDLKPAAAPNKRPANSELWKHGREPAPAATDSHAALAGASADGASAERLSVIASRRRHRYGRPRRPSRRRRAPAHRHPQEQKQKA